MRQPIPSFPSGLRAAAVVGTLLCAQSPLFAQPPAPQPAQAPPQAHPATPETARATPDPDRRPNPGRSWRYLDLPRPWFIRLVEARHEWAARAPLSDQPGSVAVSRSGGGLNLVFGAETDVQVSAPFFIENSLYRFRDASALVPAGPNAGERPLRNAFQFVAAPNFDVLVDGPFRAVGGAIFLLGGQHGIDEGGSASFGGFGGVKYRVNDDLDFTLGLSGLTQLDDRPIVLPLLGLNWSIDRQTRLILEGSELRLEHELDNEFLLTAAVGYEPRSFRLDEEGPVPGGVFRDTRIPVTLALNYEPHPAVSFTLFAGIVASQEFVVETDTGLRVSRTDVDPTPLIGVGLDLTF